MPESQQPNEGDFQNAFSDAQNQADNAAQTPEQSTPPEPQSTPPQQVDTSQNVAPEPQPPQPPQQPPAEPTQSDIAQAAARAGINVDGRDDADIMNELATGYARMRPYANWAESLAPHIDDINTLIQQKASGQQQQQQEPASREDEWSPDQYFQQQWDAPQWDRQFDIAIQNGYVRQNDKGMFEPTPGFEQMAMGLVPKMNDALRANHDLWQDITRGNPYERFHNVLREPLQREWRQDMQAMIAEELARRDAHRTVNQFEQDNAEWLFTQANGSEQSQLSDMGRRFYAAVDELQKGGLADAQQIMNYALAAVGKGPYAQSQPEQQTPPQSNQTTPDPAPATPNSPPAQQQPPSPQQSFLQNALERAAHSPNAGGFTQQDPESHPVNITEGELNSLFVEASRSSNS